jgi:hypothetical protein
MTQGRYTGALHELHTELERDAKRPGDNMHCTGPAEIYCNWTNDAWCLPKFPRYGNNPELRDGCPDGCLTWCFNYLPGLDSPESSLHTWYSLPRTHRQLLSRQLLWLYAALYKLTPCVYVQDGTVICHWSLLYTEKTAREFTTYVANNPIQCLWRPDRWLYRPNTVALLVLLISSSLDGVYQLVSRTSRIRVVGPVFFLSGENKVAFEYRKWIYNVYCLSRHLYHCAVTKSKTGNVSKRSNI